MPGCSLKGGLRWLLALSTLCLLFASPLPAHAWIEKNIESSAVELELDSDGVARVHFTLTLSVRGERLRGLTLYGADRDALPLPDGTITRLKKGRATSLPLPVNVIASGGKLEITLPLTKGFKGRRFRLEFGYRTRLLASGQLRSLPQSAWSELSWTGPKYPNGVDGAKLTLRLPTSPLAPRLAPVDDESAFGFVMSTLRRDATGDELELVRAHLAENEAMTWRIQVAQSLFASPSQSNGKASTSPTLHPTPQPELKSSGHSRNEWALVLAAGLLFSLLLAWKIHCVRKASAHRGCAPRSLIPVSTRLRVVGAGLSVACAFAAILWTNTPALGALALLFAMALATHRSSHSEQELRGTGEWRPVNVEELDTCPSEPSTGSWLDASRPTGLAVMSALLGSTALLAHPLFETSPYLGAAALCGSAVLLPIFCTGIARDLPRVRLGEGRRLLSRAYKILSRDSELLVTPLGRFTHYEDQLDELRLSVVPQRGLTGLIGLEMAVEVHSGWGGGQALPVVLIRASDRSPCHRALPRDLSWTRGRSAQERVAVVHSQWPTAEVSADLVQQVLRQLREQEAPPIKTRRAGNARPQRSKNESRSLGRGLSTAKPATRPSPAHAT